MRLKHLLFWATLLICSVTQAQKLSDTVFWKKSSLNILKKQQVITLPALEREGCEFVEWNTKEDGTGISYKVGEQFIPNGEATLYAIWKKKVNSNDTPGNDETGDNTGGDETNGNTGGGNTGGGNTGGGNTGGGNTGGGNTGGGDTGGGNTGGGNTGGGNTGGGNTGGDNTGGGNSGGGNTGGGNTGGGNTGSGSGSEGEANATTASIDALLCEGDVYTIGEKKFTDSGVYTVILVNKQGGDSIVTLNLKTAPKDNVVLKKHLIGETHYEGNGFSVDVNKGTVNTFTHSFKNQYGCDSIVTLILTSYIKPQPVHETICKGETYTIGGKVFDTTGDYEVVLGKFNGSDIDSTQQLHLFVAEPNDTTIHATVSIKDGRYSGYGFDVEKLTVGDTKFTATYKNQYGCDSVVNLMLNVTPYTVYGNDIYESICENETLNYNDSTFKPGKTYTLHETTALGFDSVVYLKIESLPTSKEVISATISLGDTYTENGFDLPEQEKAGVFYHTLKTTNQYGCDSTVIVQLTVVTPKDSITLPTLFTPNSKNGKNDIFMEGYEVYIYDRYSNLISHSINGWDGSYNGKVADPGVYIYTVILKDNRKKRGTIELYK